MPLRLEVQTGLEARRQGVRRELVLLGSKQGGSREDRIGL